MANLKQFIKDISPINTEGRVEDIFNYLADNRIQLTERHEQLIKGNIKKKKLQQLYLKLSEKYKKGHITPENNAKASKSFKYPDVTAKWKRRAQTKTDEGKPKETKAIPSVGKYKVPDWALRKLLKNGRDYRPTKEQEMFRKGMESRSESEKKRAEWERRAHIIYTPMGGQNKKY